MPVLGVSTEAVLAITAALLIFAGVEKLAVPGNIRRTLSALGFSRCWTMNVSVGLALTEVTLGGILLWARGWFVAAVLAILGCSFAAAGLAALRQDDPIECNCLGTKAGKLGMQQVALLPVWLAVAAACALVDTSNLNWVRPLFAALVSAVLGCVYVVRSMTNMMAAHSLRVELTSPMAGVQSQ